MVSNQEGSSPQHAAAPPKSDTVFTKATWAFILFFGIQAILLKCPQPKVDLMPEFALPLANKYMETSSFTSKPLQGVRVLITGPTSGIGKGLAHVLSELGASIIAVSRSASKLEQLQADLGGPSYVDPFVADFSDLNSVASAAISISDKYDHIDVIIANAGVHYHWVTLSSPHTKQGYDLLYGSKQEASQVLESPYY
jgi:NADPH:quinone reductase-like Zn-dependent oxidoreductase